MGYWKTKVLPQLKKVFDKDGKKAAASEFVKSFDESKEGINTEFEEKAAELQPKILEVYEAAPPEIKALVKERKSSGIKKNSAAVTKFLDELVKIDFPGAKQISEAATNSGPTRVCGPILVILEKVSTFLPIAKDAKEEAPSTEETVTREVEVEEKKEETVVTEEAAKAEEKVEETAKTEEKAEETAEEATPTETVPEPEPAKTKEEEEAAASKA